MMLHSPPSNIDKTYFNKGSFGKVYKVYSPKYQDFIAAKAINVNLNETENKNKTMAMITRELYAWDTLTKSNCKYNNKLLEFEDTNDENFVFYSKFHPKGALSATYTNSFLIEQVKMVRDIAKGIKECHDNNLCHADIKLENILITNQKDYILTDYGNTDVCESETFGLYNRRGTIFYMAPEVLLREYGKNTDVWSLGILAYMLFTYGDHPIFKNKDVAGSIPYHQAVDMLLHSEIQMPESVSTHLITDFLTKTLSRDKYQRLTIDEVLKHPLLKL